MSIGRRIIDLARANLNALLERSGGEGSIDELSDEQLEAELERRRQRRLQEEDERRRRFAAERAARERAQARAKQNASARQGTARPGGGSSSARRPNPGSSPPRPMNTIAERRLRELYAQLEVPYGSDFETVKRGFRTLMRKYHPDLHAHDPVKLKAATQLSMSLTQAYTELEVHFGKKAK